MNKLSTPKAPESPHLAARREWNERYGDYIKREAAWRTLAIGSMMVTGIAGLVSDSVPAAVGVGCIVAGGAGTAILRKLDPSPASP